MDEMEQQMMQYQMQQMQQALQSIDEQIMGLTQNIESLANFKQVKPGTDVLIPIVNGMFGSAKLTDNTKLKINVGNNVVVEKSIEDAIILLDGQLKEITDYKEKILNQMNMMPGKNV